LCPNSFDRKDAHGNEQNGDGKYSFHKELSSLDDYKKRQKQLLKAAGKFLKRTDLLTGSRDTRLLMNFSRELNEEKSVLFIFKLMHRGNKEYYDAFSRFYAKTRSCPPEELFLEEIVSRHGIDRYAGEDEDRCHVPACRKQAGR
jgi:uncharacterized protein (TIGR04442 family)